MYHCVTFQIGEVKIPLCMVDLAQTIEEWKDIQSVKVDDQVRKIVSTGDFSIMGSNPESVQRNNNDVRALMLWGTY